MDRTSPTPPDNEPRPKRDPDPLRTIPSEELLKGSREVHILHEGEIYRLLLTRNGKLILQK
jgi:hemin uptake protein HemP